MVRRRGPARSLLKSRSKKLFRAKRFESLLKPLRSKWDALLGEVWVGMVIDTPRMDLYTPAYVLLESALCVQWNGRFSAIDSVRYHQARELAFSARLDWHRLMLRLFEQHGEDVVSQPELWFMAHFGEGWSAPACRYACDCVERVLPHFEAVLPHDHRLRQVLVTARAGIGSAEAGLANRLRRSARSAALAGAQASANQAPYLAARAVEEVTQVVGASTSPARRVSFRAARAAAVAATRGLSGQALARAREDALRSERAAQWRLLVGHLTPRPD